MAPTTWSLRRRLCLSLALALLGIVALVGAVCLALATRRAEADFDAALQARARALVALVEQEGEQIELDYAPQFFPEFERSQEPDYFQFWLGDGTVLLRSTALTVDLAGPGGPALQDVALPDGRRGRQVRVAFQPKGPEPSAAMPDEDAGNAPTGAPHTVVLAVATGRQRLDATLAEVRAAVVVGGLLVLLLAALVGAVVLAWSLRPLRALARQVAAVPGDGGGKRVRPRAVPAELQPLVAEIDSLRGRVARAMARERRFTGHVAHELRTPIAELRNLAAVAGRWPDDPDAVRGFFGDVGAIATGMEGMIADLLLLARCGAGVETAEWALVDLVTLVREAWAGCQTAAAARGIRLELAGPPRLPVRSDAGKLRILLANLLGNAVHHGLDGSVIRGELEATADGFRLRLRNPAAHLDEADFAHLGEPFWRKGTAGGGHAGLGLALVAALAELLRLRVTFDRDPAGLFRVQITSVAGHAEARPAVPSSPPEAGAP